MTKKVEEIENTLLSIAKALPLIAGSAVGLFVSPKDAANGPAGFLANGDWQDAGKALISNYLPVNGWQGTFDMGEGKGLKALIVGFVTTKILRWID